MAEYSLIETADQFSDTSTGWAARWNVEMTAAKKNIDDWLRQGDAIVKRFVDDRKGERRYGDTRVNLFSANIQTLHALLYGKTPAVDVKRRFADPNDDTARVAGEMLQRLLNTDIERDDDNYASALESALGDRLLSGLGVVRVRYEREESPQDPVPAIKGDGGEELAPEYTPEPSLEYECVETDYVHWKDFRWSPARTWDEVRWIAFKAAMTRDAVAERFGEEAARAVPLMMRKTTAQYNDKIDEGDKENPWARCEVWEIWSKEHRKVYWWVDGYHKLLDEKEDTLGLEGFWPVARPMFANLTTSKLIPTPDFVLAQDLYDEVDLVSTRITLLERAVAVRGVYDKTSDEIKRLLSETTTMGNELIPVDNFNLFKEKGGLASVVDWLPLDAIVNALDKMREYRGELMALLFQVTGMSDIMRGQSSEKGATATEQALKAKFASVRVQAWQNEFARFAGDTQSLKAEIISKHYDPKTIYECSNAQYMTGNDPMLAKQAIDIIKSDIYQYRIEVKPESVMMADMASIKAERSEFLMAMATYFQSAVPVMQLAPWAAPYMLQILQWSMAGYRGGATIEGVLDQMVLASRQAAQQAAMQPPPPDPKIEAAKIKGQIDMQKGQMDIVAKKEQLKGDMMKMQMELQAKAAEMKLDMQKAQMDHEVDKAGAEMDLRQQESQLQMDAKKGALEEERMTTDHALKMEQSQATHEAKLAQAKEAAKAKPKPQGGK
jgi:hypothetical protein